MRLEVRTFAMASDICYEIKEVNCSPYTVDADFVEYSRPSSSVADLCFRDQWQPLSYISPCLTGKGGGQWDEVEASGWPGVRAARSQMGLSGLPSWCSDLCLSVVSVTLQGLIRMTNGTGWKWRGAAVQPPLQLCFLLFFSLLPSLILLWGQPVAVAWGHPRSHREATGKGSDQPMPCDWAILKMLHPGQGLPEPWLTFPQETWARRAPMEAAPDP